MTRLHSFRALLVLGMLAFSFAAPMPVAYAADQCNPSSPSSCPSGQQCKKVNDEDATCVAIECTPACKSTEVCFLGNTCIAKSSTTNPGGTEGTTNPGGTQGTANSGAGGLQNPLNNINSIDDLLGAVLGAVVRIGSIILVLALVYIGFLFVVAQGNEEKLKSARTALLWTVIGGLILLGATAIKEVITATVDAL